MQNLLGGLGNKCLLSLISHIQIPGKRPSRLLLFHNDFGNFFLPTALLGFGKTMPPIFHAAPDNDSRPGEDAANSAGTGPSGPRQACDKNDADRDRKLRLDLIGILKQRG
jgi:hypothetical protein